MLLQNLYCIVSVGGDWSGDQSDQSDPVPIALLSEKTHWDSKTLLEYLKFSTVGSMK